MNTKRMLLIAGTAGLFAGSLSAQVATVEGRLSGIDSDTLLVDYFPISDLKRENLKTDAVAIRQGHFTYKVETGNMPAEMYFYAKPKSGEASSLRKTVSVVAFPGETVRLTGPIDDYQAEGNVFHKNYAEAAEGWKSAQQRMEVTTEVIMKMQQEGQLNPQRIDSLRQIYQPIADEISDCKEQYIRKYPDSDVSVYLLADLGGARAKVLLPLVGEKAKTGPMSSLYLAMQDALKEAEARKAASQNIKEGKEAPEFVLKDINGKDFALSSLRGKYVVLDFWGSWCGWCIKGLPDMKKAYEKYKDRMEIVGIDCGDTEKKWKAAVAEHEIPWLHVRNAGQEDLTVVYAVKGFPTKIVIDPQGKIARVVVGEDPAFYTYLDSLFKL